MEGLEWEKSAAVSVQASAFAEKYTSLEMGLECVGIGEGSEKGSQSLGRGVWGRQPAPCLAVLKTKLTLTPNTTIRAPPSSEITCLSPRLEGGGGCR